MIRSYVLLSILVMSRLADCYNCPESCDCFENFATVIVDCWQRNLTTLPRIAAENDKNVLVRMDVRDNMITELSPIADGPARLHYLALSGNKIAQCQPGWADAAADSLVELDLSNNRLTGGEITKAVSGLAALRQLDVSNNDITSFDFSLSLPSEVEILIANNVSVPTIPAGAFLSTPDLKSLIMVGSDVSYVEADAFANVSDTINQLDLSQNRLDAASLPAIRNLTALSDLNLANNNISLTADVKLFLDASALQHLDLHGNPLTYFSGSNLIDSINLEQLQLDGTNLTQLVFPVGIPIKLLSLSFNQLTATPAGIERLDYLERLDLRNNSIRELPVVMKNGSFLSQLKSIDLSGNLLEYPPKKLFWSHPLIQRVVICDGIITGIGAYTFAYSSDVTFIDLSHNRISFVGYQAFYGVRSLTEINLSHNQIADLFQDIFPVNPAGLIFNLLNNPFRCSCEANWLIEFSAQNEFLAPECATPERPAGVDLWTLDSETKWSCFNSTTTTTTPTPEISSKQAITTFTSAILLSTQVSVMDLCPEECVCYLYPSYMIYDCQHNQWQTLPSLPPQNESSRSILNFSHNKLVSMPKGSLSQGLGPFSVSLSHNLLEDINSDWSGQSAQAILYLDLSHNSLPPSAISAAVEKMVNLIELDVTANGLISLDQIDLHSLPLQTLSAGQNQLTTIDGPPLKELASLKHLNLSYNQLESIHPSALELSSSNLEVVDLTSNRLSRSVFQSLQSCSAVMKLLLGGNEIDGVDVVNFINFASVIQTLSLSSNPVQHIAANLLSDLTALEELFVDDAQITEMEFLSEIPLKVLSVSHNSLSDIPFGMELLSDLRELHLGNNSLTYLPNILKDKSILPKLRVIDLSSNLFYYPPKRFIQTHPRLQKIIMRDGRMTRIGSYTFVNSTDAQLIDLSNNLIGIVGYAAFANISKNAVIDLSNNNLASLPLNSFISPSPPQQMTLTFDRNPFACNCEGNWIREFAANNTVIVPDCIRPEKPADVSSWNILTRSSWPCGNETSTPTSSTRSTKAPLKSSSLTSVQSLTQGQTTTKPKTTVRVNSSAAPTTTATAISDGSGDQEITTMTPRQPVKSTFTYGSLSTSASTSEQLVTMETKKTKLSTQSQVQSTSSSTSSAMATPTSTPTPTTTAAPARLPIAVADSTGNINDVPMHFSLTDNMLFTMSALLQVVKGSRIRRAQL